MVRLLRPVMKIMSVMPAAAASSTAYWMSGLSTTGIISLGLALVAGRNRLPMPATGNTALVSCAFMFCHPSRLFRLRPRQRKQSCFVQYRDPEFQGAIVIAPRFSSRDHVVGLFRYR